MDELYKKEEHELKLYYDTLLLSELLRCNYEFSNHKYNGVCGNDVLDITLRKEKYSNKEINSIIYNALLLLNIKYSYKINDDYLEQYNNIEFKKQKK